MPRKQFEKHKNVLLTRCRQKAATLSSVAATYWNEIYNQQYNFKRQNMDVKYLEDMRQDQLTNLFEASIFDYCIVH